ncbi:MAG TPA: enoyl-CoA hydratase-related protein [Caulobacterales bacterium]|nr:enoyl-CoA hydratase-related protein [Caulobacterales bacterium]
MTGTITLSIEGPVATITIDRAETRNPLGLAGDGALVEGFCTQINADLSIRCAIITGAGQAFSAGGDVKAMRDRTGGFAGSPAEIGAYYEREIHRLLKSLHGLETPLIAAVHGPAIGLGCDVACLADIRLASTQARFGATFLKLGLIPGDGGAWILPRAIGRARAAELFFTGDVIDAQTALDWGLVSRVIEPAALMDEARALARKIAEQPPLALRETKKLLGAAQTASYEEILTASAITQGRMHHTADHAEGVAALLEKRPPRFSGG